MGGHGAALPRHLSAAKTPQSESPGNNTDKSTDSEI